MFAWLACPLLRTLACYGFVHFSGHFVRSLDCLVHFSGHFRVFAYYGFVHFSGRLHMLAYYVLFILAGTAVFAVPPCGRYMEIFVKKP